MFEDQTATTRAARRRRELFPELMLTAHLVMFVPQTRAVQAMFERADL